MFPGCVTAAVHGGGGLVTFIPHLAQKRKDPLGAPKEGQLHSLGPGRARAQGLGWELVLVNAVKLRGAAAFPLHEEPKSNR